ncbi:MULTISPECIES: DUF6069 family protein [unclassified Spirillospora]|uniref:DUF6069 family protein n=1 Tax=unclassified Spirillospora TaxID=2642701 RepID=UPI0037236677
MNVLSRALGVAGAVAAPLTVWVVGDPLLGHELVVEQSGREATNLGAVQIIVFALAASLLGWALLAILERVTTHALRIWTVVAVVVLALSFLPLTGVEATGGSKTVLALAHIAVAAVLIPLFWRTSARSRKAEQPAQGAGAVGSR